MIFNEMESNFYNARITHIVAFECSSLEFNEKNIDSLRKITFCGVIPSSIEQIKLNNKIFSELFVDRYPKILNVTLEINFLKIIDENRISTSSKLKLLNRIFGFSDFLSKNIIIKICFDQIGISSVRFDFEIKDCVKTTKLIQIADSTSCFVDEILFPELKNKLMKILDICQDNSLKVHDTYTIITSTDSNIDLVNNNEISGIVTLTANYTLFNKNIIESKSKNQFSLYEDTLINIGYTATLMIFNNPKYFTENPEIYINERINALETYHRQKYLLKKLDIYLDDLIRNLEKNFNHLDVISLKNKMAIIKKTQIDIQSKLEIYRNTRTFTTASFVKLFDIYNNVFQLDKHYKFVIEKLDACDNVYQGFHDQIRNELMEDIQVIVAILGTLSLVLMFIDLLVDQDGLIQLILIPIFILAIWISRKHMLNSYYFLKRKILDTYSKTKLNKNQK